jgi:hypothetical protein
MRAIVTASLLAFLVVGASRPLPAQQSQPWFVAVRAVPTAFGSAASSDDPTADELGEIGPAPDLRGSLSVGRQFGRWEASVAGGYGKHGLKGSDGSSSVTIEPGYTLATLGVTAAYAIVTTAKGARVQLFAGPTLSFWSGDAVPDSRTRLGGTGGVGLVAPVAGRLSVDAHAALGLASSPIDAEELSGLESDYETGAMWSRELGVGLRLSF